MRLLIIFLFLINCLFAVSHRDYDFDTSNNQYSGGKHWCKKNERYVECPATLCIAQWCSELGHPVPCPRVRPHRRCPGKPGCVCRKGYLRNDDGVCIPKWKCPLPCQSNGSEPNNNGSNSNNSGNNSTNSSDQCSGALKLLQDGIIKFTNTFLHEAYKANPKTNTISSPFSLFVPMGELALYAEDDTYNQLINFLNLRNKDDIRCVFPELLKRFKGIQNVTINLAARIFATDVHPLTKEFLDDGKNVFEADPESLDFSDPPACVKRVDEWVASATNDRIKQIAREQMFGPTGRLVLANAIYFLGTWEKIFDETLTSDRDFNVDSQTIIQIPTMVQSSFFNYGEVSDLNCKVLEMFYEGGEFSFVIFLPNEIEGLSVLLEKLQEPNALLNAYNSITRTDVIVILPKIKTDSTYELKEYLEAANIKDLFTADCKLNNILEQYEPLVYSGT